jgi:hypothetical protein
MRTSALICRATVAAVSLAGLSFVGSAAAGASPVGPSDFTCGLTVFTPCNQTAHFSTPSGTSGPEVGTPSPQATGCPSFILTDAPVIQGTGNGIEHSVVNNNGDGWFTSTFSGTVTIVLWTVDGEGNLVAPDPSAPSLTGHMTQWFGGSFNNKNFVNHDVINFSGTGSDGSILSVHILDHMNVPASAAAAPNTFDVASCS